MVAEQYPPDWDSRRREVYQRDEYTCQNCGRKGGHSGSVELHAHHIVPKSSGGTHSKSNLTTMCSECHNAIHNDAEAPTTQGRLDTEGEIIDYQNLWELSNSVVDSLFEEGSLHVATPDSWKKVDINKIIVHYDDQGKHVRKRVHSTKRSISDFDPYDNYNSEHVDEEFKELVEEFLEIFLDLLNQFLEIDRLIERYVQQLTTVKCPECTKDHNYTDDFCGNCGCEIPTILACPDCHEIREETQQGFCKNCGGKLNQYPERRLDQIEKTIILIKNEKEKLEDIVDKFTEIADRVGPKWKEQIPG